MLFRGVAGEGIKDMRKVRGPLFNSPVLHGGSHDVRQRGIELHALFDGLAQGLVDNPRQALLHHLVAEHVAAVNFGGLGVGVVERGQIGLVARDGPDSVAAGIASAHAYVLLEGCLLLRKGWLYSKSPSNGRGGPTLSPRLFFGDRRGLPLYEACVLGYMREL